MTLVPKREASQTTAPKVKKVIVLTTIPKTQLPILTVPNQVHTAHAMKAEALAK